MQLMKLKQAGVDDLIANIETRLPRYQAHDRTFFANLLHDHDYLVATGIEIQPFRDDLVLGDADTPESVAAADRKNAAVIYKAMQHLPLYLAADEKMWAALTHTHLFDFICAYRGEKLAPNEREAANSFFTKTQNGRKRAIFVNCISRLWWAAHLLYDNTANDPYHFLDVIAAFKFSGSLTLLSSSNIAECKPVICGLFHVLEKRLAAGEHLQRQRDLVEPLRYLNLIAGTTIIDEFDAADIEALVRKFFVHQSQRPPRTQFSLSA